MARTQYRQLLFGTGIRRICGVAAASTAAEMIRLVRVGLRETPTLELRLDWLRNDSERDRFLRWLKRSRSPRATFLATCRRRAGGGKLAGSVRRELYWLNRAREAGCAWCDLEVETQRALRSQALRELGLPPKVLLSLHNFERTPAGLHTAEFGARSGVRAVKVAVNSRTIQDSVRVLQLARRSPRVVAVPMGEAGLPARVLALREGSQLAYAPISEATAPGQVPLHDLIHLYRAHELTARTRVYGVIGEPIGHSLSPLLHNTAFLERNINAVYLPFLVSDLRDFLKAASELGLRGFSVTIPHKQAVLKHLRECDPPAAEIGAVNTVLVRRNGSLYGCNTDYVGVLRALEKKLDLCGSRILVLGAGGSARAAAFALAKARAHVLICARREKAARELARAVEGDALPGRTLSSMHFDAILNATPTGMYPHEQASPLLAREINCRVAMDFVYRPEKTQFLKMAARKGIATVSGLEMFLAQGLAQWELWTGQRAPEAAMRRAVSRALHKEEKARRAIHPPEMR